MHHQHAPSAMYPVSSLEQLPEEILNRIAHYAAPSATEVRIINSFRSTSKLIEAKTRHHFARIGFSAITLDFSFRGLARLQEIVDHGIFLKAVKALCVGRTEIAREEYDRLRNIVQQSDGESDQVVQRARKAVAAVDEDYKERDYLETSGHGVALLTRCLLKLPNFSHIHVDAIDMVQPPARDYIRSTVHSPNTSTILMKCVLAAVVVANVHLQKLTMPTSKSGIGYHQGVCPSAFSLPDRLSPILHHLVEVRLILVTGYKIDREFLFQLPALKHVDLILNESDFGRGPHPEGLRALTSGEECASAWETLSLEGVNISPSPSDRLFRHSFLRPHASTLKKLTLRTCNFCFCRLHHVLEALKGFSVLKTLVLHRISENYKRVSFGSQGLRTTIDLKAEGRHFDNEGWVLLDRSNRYLAVVEEWEVMAERLEEIQVALECTDTYYGSDAGGPGVEWYDVSDLFYY